VLFVPGIVGGSVDGQATAWIVDVGLDDVLGRIEGRHRGRGVELKGRLDGVAAGGAYGDRMRLDADPMPVEVLTSVTRISR
jgi:hypothetical protein